MKNLNKFIADYTADMEADNRRFVDLMFERALNIKIDLSCIDRIVQGIKDDQPRFDKWCEVMAKRKQDEEDKLCCVCYECEADQPLNCSHKLCLTCSTRVDKCPLCRKSTGLEAIEGWTLMMPRRRETIEEIQIDDEMSDSDDDQDDGFDIQAYYEANQEQVCYDCSDFFLIVDDQDSGRQNMFFKGPCAVQRCKDYITLAKMERKDIREICPTRLLGVEDAESLLSLELWLEYGESERRNEEFIYANIRPTYHNNKYPIHLFKNNDGTYDLHCTWAECDSVEHIFKISKMLDRTGVPYLEACEKHCSPYIKGISDIRPIINYLA
jgi:hypothetical protein